MIRILWTTGAVAVAAVALAGCQRTAPPPVEPPKGPDVAVPGALKFGAIDTVCSALPAGLPVVKIQVTDVSPKKIGHVTALFASNQDGTASSDKKLKDIPEVVLKTENPTRLDFDASEFLKKKGDAILVEVELADAAASFVTGPAALTAGNADGQAIFCIRDKQHPVGPKAGDRTVRFYAQYVETKSERFAKFNIFLLLKDGPYTTPVVLDPKVRDIG